MIFSLLAATALGASEIPGDHVHGDRVRTDLKAIQQRIADGKGPLAFIACTDETRSGACTDDVQALYASLPLDQLRAVQGPNRISGQFYMTFIPAERPHGPVWQLRFLPQQDANDVVLLRRYLPIPGPPLPPEADGE